MVKVGDHICVSSMKGPDREGVVTAVTGPLVRVRWQSDQETTLVPAPGTLTVLAGATGPRPPTKKKATAKANTGKRKSTSATPKKQTASKLKGNKRPAP